MPAATSTFAQPSISLPSWKAVFFNPKTDTAVIDRIITSIEDVA